MNDDPMNDATLEIAAEVLDLSTEQVTGMTRQQVKDALKARREQEDAWHTLLDIESQARQLRFVLTGKWS